MRVTLPACPATDRRAVMNNMRAFLGRGALAGAAGGVVAAVFQWAVTEQHIREALALEAANETGTHTEMFSRTTQVVGGMVGIVFYGIFLGLIFGFLSAVLWRRVSPGATFSRSISLAMAVFVSWTLVPALKYPANPPGVGDPDTIDQRTASYLVLVVVSVLVAFLAREVWRQMTARGFVGAPRFAAVAAGYLAAIAALYVAFPANPDAIDAPANLIWHFRLDSLAENALLWLVLGTAFGWLGDRAAAHAASRPPDHESVPV